MRIACETKTSNFKKMIPYNSKGRYWFKDNGSNILAVAHLDSVQQCTHFHEMRLPHLHRVYCPVLDDRLGVYIILHLLPKLGLKYDILLTTDEEIGRSTADNFTTTKQYNWVFEFDRKDDDVVMYNYETKEMKENLEKVGWKVGRGSYSDISELEFLDCKAFNFGTGYANYHSLDAYVDLKVLTTCIQKFYLFYNKFKDVYLSHKKAEKKVYSFRDHRFHYDDYGYGYGSYYGGYSDGTFTCTVCGGSGWNAGKKCNNCSGTGYVVENDDKKTIVKDNLIITTTEKKIVSTTEKKITTLPTHSDFYTYSCLHCGSYIEIDLDTAGNEAISAAEDQVCVKCASTIKYFT